MTRRFLPPIFSRRDISARNWPTFILEQPSRSSAAGQWGSSPSQVAKLMGAGRRTEYPVKFISDTYYARVYRLSSAKIGVEDYRALVDEKLKTAGELYEFMVSQFNERRMFVVELVVAVLVLLDVILLLRGSK